MELIVGAKEVPKPAAPKGLADRMAYVPFPPLESALANTACRQPKSATKKENKPKTNGAATTTKGAKPAKGAARKAGRAGKPNKKKTAEELDAEMADYFNPADAAAAAAAANGTAAPAAGGDAMVDEVL